MYKKISSVALSLAILLSTGSVALANQNLQGLDLNVVEKINIKNVKGASNQEVTDLQNELKELIEQAEDTDTLVLKTDESIKTLNEVVNQIKKNLNSQDANILKENKKKLKSALISISSDINDIKDLNSLKKSGELNEGVYNVPVVLRNFDSPDLLSMGNDCLLHKAKLIVDKDKNIKIRFCLKGLYFMSTYGHLVNLWYFNPNKEDSHKEEDLGGKIKPNILSYNEELNLNKELYSFPKTIEINIEKFKDLCAFQYCDFEGNASSNGKFNPNGSLYAIEGMISEDGLVLGKMGHSERYGTGLYKNKTIKGIQNIFRNGVNYFKGEK